MRPKTAFKTVFALIAFAVLIHGAGQLAISQTTGGTLRGTVEDTSGAVVQNATVTAVNDATGAKFNTLTSSAGLYSYPNLLVGKYTVTVEFSGFKKYVIKDVTVSANEITEANAKLEVGAVSTTVEVVGGSELVELTTSQIGETIQTKAVMDLPNSVLGGSPLNLVISMPNTTTQAGGVLGEGGSIGGNRPRNNNFTVDGVDNNSVSVTGPLQPVIQDAVAEFNFISNQFSAEYGHSTAGQFNIITKSGTNQYHGDAFYYVQNRNLNAMDNLEKAAFADGTLDKKPRFDFNRLGGTFGGPIMKDKLFFFGAYQYSTTGQASTGVTVLGPTQQGMDMLQSLAANSTVLDYLSEFPVASSQLNDETVIVNKTEIPVGNIQLFAPDYDTEHDFQTNVDYYFGQHQLRGRFLYTRYRAPNLNYMLPMSKFTGDIYQNARKLSFSDVWSINARMANDFRLSYSRNDQGWSVPAAFADWPNIEIDELGLNVGPDDNSPQSDIQNSYQVINNFSYIKGRHQVKLGIEYRDVIAPSDFLPRSRGEWDYASMQTFINDYVPDGLNDAKRGVGSGFFAANQHSIYWFVQDDFQVTPQLTLNLGLRYEFTSNPRDADLQELNAISDLPGVYEFRKPKTDKNNFGPRFGFAYAPNGGDGFLGRILGSQGQSSLRGGFGVGYDVNFNNLVILSLPPQLQSEQNPDLTCGLSNAPAWCETGQGFLQGGGLLSVHVPPTDQFEARYMTQGLIVDQVAPVTYTWSLGFQREFAQKYSLEVRYMGTRGLRLPVQAITNLISVFDNHPEEQGLPTYFYQSDVPANVSQSATSLMDIWNLWDYRYGPEEFYGLVYEFLPVGNSIYHAGSVEFKRRFAENLYLTANYTWSRTIDDSTNELFSSRVNPRRPQDYTNMKNERGLSALDMPHKFTFSWMYELPKIFKNNNLASKLLDNWQINGTFLAQSGQPVTALSGQDANEDGDSAGDRALLNPHGFEDTGSDISYVMRDAETGDTSIVPSYDPNDYDEVSSLVGYVAVNPWARYVVAGEGTPDNSMRVGRNTLRSIGLNNWDISIFKNFTVMEGKTIQYRLELYNAFNHRQYSLGLPTYQQFNDNAYSSTYSNVSAPQFMDATQFNGGSRTMQMALKFMF